MKGRSRGAVALGRTGKTYAVVADRCECSTSLVGFWVAGTKRPGPTHRATLRAWLGIDPAWWDEPAAPRATVKPAAVVPAPGATSVPAGRVHELAVALEERAHRLMADLDGDPLATPLERAKVVSSIAATLNTIGAIVDPVRQGRRMLRDRAWPKVEAALAEALRGNPEAARDLAPVLDRIERDLLEGGE